MFESIEPFVIVSSRKTQDGNWIWTRGSQLTAEGLAAEINRRFLEEGRVNVVITVLDVASGITTLCYR